MTTACTSGIHHIGLTVSRLEESAQFFTRLLGWKEVRRKPEYPAIFVSDGQVMVTLWATKTDNPAGFDRHTHVGLHHLAFRVTSEAELRGIHDRLAAAGVPIEFSPQTLGDGPAMHMMCYDPSGVRIEFTWPGN